MWSSCGRLVHTAINTMVKDFFGHTSILGYLNSVNNRNLTSFMRRKTCL